MKGHTMVFQNITGGGTSENSATWSHRTSLVATLIKHAACVAAAGIAIAAAAFPGTALAAVDFSKHTVDTVSPAGTTINLFDYWMTKQSDPDNSSAAGGVQLNGGINADHRFKFVLGSAGNNGDMNCWTQAGGGPNTGIVANTLVDNFPKLAGETQESLAYLFDPSNMQNAAYKKAFTGVGGLLQVDNDGYYYYNSQDNFASFDESTKKFTLYDSNAVKRHAPGNLAIPDGQFFPFNTADQVFETNEDGTPEVDKNGHLVAKNIPSTDPVFNHWFGMTMTTRFQQPEGGIADNKGTETTADDVHMTYEFSGDDDVWIFIDGVLVGDLGGIHDANRIVIDFATGDVTTYNKVMTNNPNGTKLSATTIAEMFEKAGVTTGIEGNTLKDNTVHTLKFFYLERGNYASNMRLRFNLMSVPESSVVKVDQTGEAIANVPFELYGVDKVSGTYGSQTLVAEGMTDENGKLILMSANPDEEGQAFSFDLQESGASGKTAYGTYVLHEARVPVGYRQGRDVKLQYHKQIHSAVGGYVTSFEDDMWETGSNVESGVQVTAPSAFYKNVQGEDGLGAPDKEPIPDDVIQKGTLFALVLKYEGDGKSELSDGSKWKAVTGNALEGWKLDDVNNIEGAIAAAKRMPRVFTPVKGNTYHLNIEELPGDLSTYYQMIAFEGDKADFSKVKYTVAYYFTSANSIDGANKSNTWRLYSEGTSSTDKFQRVFSTRLMVPNIKNRLFVQKTDESWNPLQDSGEYPSATFSLYRDQDVTVANGSLTVKDGASAYDTASTQAELNTDGGQLLMNNGAVFPAGKDVLPRGTYYLVENAAPAGYRRWDSCTKIIVTNDGVYADAGAADDDVRVLKGAGSLVQTMAVYASGGQVNAKEGDIDATLKDITLTLQSGDPEIKADGTNWDYGWKNVDGVEQKHLTYAATGAVLEYGPTSESAADTVQGKLNQVTFAIDRGWGDVAITQNLGERGPAAKPSSDAKKDLGDRSLNTLFSGTTTVQIANHAVATMSIEKKGENLPDSQKDAAFSMTLKLWNEDKSGVKTALAEGTVFGVRLSGAPNATRVEVGGQDGAATNKSDGNGSWTEYAFQLKAGQKVFVGAPLDGDGNGRLPAGVHYELTEANPGASYAKPTFVNDKGTLERTPDELDPNATAQVVVTNRWLTGLALLKIDPQGDGEADDIRLDGVEFKLFKANAAGDGPDEAQLIKQGLTADGGKLAFDDLDQGVYYLKETKALSGYQLLASPMKVVVENGKVIFYNGEGEKEAEGVLEVTIENRKVPSLPQTGGPGNLPLYAAGMVLIAGAAFAFEREHAARKAK